MAASYERMARWIAAYGTSPEANPFTSKYDYYLKGEVNPDRRRKSGAGTV